MLDGSDTNYDEPQIGQSIFGFLIGITCCVASFLFGRLLGCYRRGSTDQPRSVDSVAGAITEVTNDRTHDQSMDLESAVAEPSWHLMDCCSFHIVLPCIILLALLAAYLVGDSVAGISFYRGMWMSTLLSPFGAILRWRLSTLNRSTVEQRWFPWGTFVANVSASVIAVTAEALQANLADGTNQGLAWAVPLLLAIEVGFSGSLSTVSTMVRELCSWKGSPWKSILYFITTIVSATLLSMAVYSPAIRAG